MRAPARSQLALLPSEWEDLERPQDLEAKPAAKAKAAKPNPEDLFADQCRRFRLPPVVPQLRFAKAMGRQWRFDFAFPDFLVAVEIEGLVVQKLAGQLVVRGRHASIAGIIEDMEKYNTAALLGWTVLRFAQKQVKPEHAINMTMRVLAARGWKGVV